MFDRKRQMHEYDVTLSVSYMEIYRDEVYDLLVDRESVSHSHNLFRMLYTIRELTAHHSSSSNRLLSCQSGRMMLAKSL
jgi:hypothetical protein